MYNVNIEGSKLDEASDNDNTSIDESECPPAPEDTLSSDDCKGEYWNAGGE